MSDTKILSGEQVRNVFRMGSDISMVQVCESHYAQAQRIAELKQSLKQLGLLCTDARNERDAALLRAEQADKEIRRLTEIIWKPDRNPPERESR